MSRSVQMVAIAAAILGFSAVVLGALGSHLVDMNDQPGLQRIWQTASIMHLFHSAALLGLAALLSNRISRTLLLASWSMIAGTVVFCGSLYLRVISADFTTAAAPFGGVLLMLGWLLVLLSFVRKP